MGLQKKQILPIELVSVLQIIFKLTDAWWYMLMAESWLCLDGILVCYLAH